MAKKATAVAASNYTVPVIKEGQKVKGTILKEIENGVLVNCENGAFTGIILSKEAKELKRSQFDLNPSTELELEIINPAVRLFSFLEGGWISKHCSTLIFTCCLGLYLKSNFLRDFCISIEISSLKISKETSSLCNFFQKTSFCIVVLCIRSYVSLKHCNFAR